MKAKNKLKFLNQRLIQQNSALFLFLLSYFGIEPVEGAEPIINLICSISVLSLTAIFCLINVFNYFIVLYLINQYNIEVKYPRFKRFFNYYKTSTLSFIIFEFILGSICLISIFIWSVMVIKQML